MSSSEDRILLVEADGFGGAVMQVIEGNYPIDYLIHDERKFSTESEAMAAAESFL